MNKSKIAQFFLYLWLLIWPWQTKLILRSADSPYLEISFFLSLGLLLVPIIIWSYSIFESDYWRFKKGMTNPKWWVGLIIFELVTFASIFWADDKLLALYRYLILVYGILLFYIIKNSELVKIKLVVRYFLIGLIPSALLAIWQFFTQSTIATKYLGLAYHSASVLGDAVIESGGSRYLRAYGSFDHPNILGGLMVLGILLVLYFSLQKEIKRNERLFYLITLAIFYLALLVSFSRAAWLGFIVSAPFILFYAWRRGRFQKKLIGLFIFLTLGISLAFVVPNINLFLARAQTDNRLEMKSVSERELYLEQAKTIIKQQPILGTGASNYILDVQKNIPKQPTWYYQPVHNYWLLIWAELGIFGLVGVIIFWFSLFRISLKKNLWLFILTLFVFSLLDHWLWTQTLGILVFFVIMGVIFNENN